MKVSFKDLIGKSGILCAVSDHKFRLGNLTLEAVEDEQDDYRSSLAYLQAVDSIRPTFRETVFIRKTDNQSVNCIEFINENNQCVLTVGTTHYDEYYPCFTFQFYPDRLTANQPPFDIDRLITTVDENI